MQLKPLKTYFLSVQIRKVCLMKQLMMFYFHSFVCSIHQKYQRKTQMLRKTRMNGILANSHSTKNSLILHYYIWTVTQNASKNIAIRTTQEMRNS